MVKNEDGTLMLGFIKYGQLEHLKSLQSGSLYCNTIQYFANCDEATGIGDKYETITKQTFGPSLILDLANGDLNNNHALIILNPNGDNQHLYSNTEFYANLFCLYSVNSKVDGHEYKIELPESMSKTYAHMLIIRDTVEFVKRVIRRLQELKLQYQFGLIEYKDLSDFSGRKTYFQKPLRYKNQSEYRIMIKNTMECPMIIDIGSIHDISEIYTTEQVKRVKVYV